MKHELVVEIRGVAGAGKSLLASVITEELRVLGFQVDNTDTGAEFWDGHRSKLADINREIPRKVTIVTKLCSKDGT
jgi:adenylylsulfate kinase-like enzyme